MNMAGTELPLESIDLFAKKLGASNVNFSIFSFFEPTLKEDRLKYSIEEIEDTPSYVFLFFEY